MTALSALADNFATNERPAGNLLDGPSVLAQAVAAARLYGGYAEIRAHAGVVPAPVISGSTEISNSEWAIIRPLFMLYVERETALQLEASRGLGMDVFGRSSSEVASDIFQFEADLPHRAFFRPIITV
jgi:hypothetical protein